MVESLPAAPTPRPPLLLLPTSRRTRPTPALALLLFVAPLASCGGETGAGDGRTVSGGVRRSEPPKVLVAEVEQREMTRYLETTTKIESEREITIHPEVNGIVVKVLAEEGDEVEAGDVLCVLDSRDQELAVDDARVALDDAKTMAAQPELDREEAEARVESTRLAYEQAQRDHERDQRLFEGSEVASPVSRQTLEASRLAMETAKADHDQAKIAAKKVEITASTTEIAVARADVALKRAEHALSQRTVKAPFAGTIAMRSVRLGQNIGPADPIYTLTDTRNIRAVFYRAQEELALFTQGTENGNGHAAPPVLTFQATTEALPGAVFLGRVLRVSPTIDRDSGQFRVTGVFDLPDDPTAGPLLPGMLVRLRIATDRHPDALVVPKRAIRREGELGFLYVVEEDDTIRRVDVEEGYGDPENTEVFPLDGAELDAGMRVVSVGSRDLEDGDPVVVEEPRDVGDGEDPGPDDEGDDGDDDEEETSPAALEQD